MPDDGTDALKHIAHLSAAFDGILVMSIKYVCNYKVTVSPHSTHIHSGDEIWKNIALYFSNHGIWGYFNTHVEQVSYHTDVMEFEFNSHYLARGLYNKTVSRPQRNVTIWITICLFHSLIVALDENTVRSNAQNAMGSKFLRPLPQLWDPPQLSLQWILGFFFCFTFSACSSWRLLCMQHLCGRLSCTLK